MKINHLTELELILNKIADKLNLPTTEKQAIELNQQMYLHLEFNSIYGGYRVVNFEIGTGRHYGAFGGSGSETRISKKLMLLKLNSILLGIELANSK